MILYFLLATSSSISFILVTM